MGSQRETADGQLLKDKWRGFFMDIRGAGLRSRTGLFADGIPRPPGREATMKRTLLWCTHLHGAGRNSLGLPQFAALPDWNYRMQAAVERSAWRQHGRPAGGLDRQRRWCPGGRRGIGQVLAESRRYDPQRHPRRRPCRLCRRQSKHRQRAASSPCRFGAGAIPTATVKQTPATRSFPAIEPRNGCSCGNTTVAGPRQCGRLERGHARRKRAWRRSPTFPRCTSALGDVLQKNAGGSVGGTGSGITINPRESWLLLIRVVDVNGYTNLQTTPGEENWFNGDPSNPVGSGVPTDMYIDYSGEVVRRCPRMETRTASNPRRERSVGLRPEN